MLAHVDDVVSESLLKLTTRAIRTCPSTAAIPALLRKIVGNEAVDLLRRPWAKQQQKEAVENPAVEMGIVSAADFLNPADDGIENLDRLRGQLAEWMRLDVFDLEVLVQRLVQALPLTAFDEMLLRDHILGGQTQAEFAERNGCPLGRVGRRTMELLLRIRRLHDRRIFL